ncbi:hypothetical protein ACFL1M_00295 [Patescibacteria group bacterium]
MLAASHAIAGAIIASAASTPEVGYLAALISHPLLDLFPHWDFNTRHNIQTKWQIIYSSLLDAGVGFAIGLALFSETTDWKVLVATMFIAQLPDWIEAPYHVFEWDFPPFSTIKRLQHFWHTKLDWPWGFIPQAAVVLFAIFLSRK